MVSLSPNEKPESISDLLRKLEATIADGEVVTVGYVLEVFGVRGFAFLLCVLALLNVAIFMVPGLSILFGLPMVILAVQMVLGIRAPIFPEIVRARTIRRDLLIRGLEIGVRVMKKVERLTRPRAPFLSGPILGRVHCVLLLALSMMVAIPLPFLNLPPSLGVIVMSVGVMQRDGAFIAAAYLIAGWSFWIYESLQATIF